MILNSTTVFSIVHYTNIVWKRREIYADFVQKFYYGINYQTYKCIGERQIREDNQKTLLVL